MSQDQDTNLAVRRIVLPSGRTIEVIRYGNREHATRALHVCPSCESHLVQPLSWQDGSEGRCEMTLECPNCHWFEDGTYEREQLDRLEDHLDAGLAEMLTDLQRLTRSNLAEEADRFSAALAADLILPEDF